MCITLFPLWSIKENNLDKCIVHESQWGLMLFTTSLITVYERHENRIWMNHPFKLALTFAIMLKLGYEWFLWNRKASYMCLTIPHLHKLYCAPFLHPSFRSINTGVFLLQFLFQFTFLSHIFVLENGRIWLPRLHLPPLHTQPARPRHHPVWRHLLPGVH